MNNKFTSMKAVGIILIIIGIIYLFSSGRGIQEALLWLGLGTFLIARFNPEDTIRYRNIRTGLVWGGLIVAAGAFLTDIILYAQKILSTAIG